MRNEKKTLEKKKMVRFLNRTFFLVYTLDFFACFYDLCI